ncbi:MAG: SsrA-binding protein SmpB [Bacilli bacterium]|jgi:SsrA-binding protein
MEQAKIKVVSENRKARFDYFLEERYEAGLVLLGTEIKALREHAVNIKDAYVIIKNDEAYILNMNIAEYSKGNLFNHEPARTRKLLLHKKEILKMKQKVQEAGYTLIPTKVYLTKGRAKVEIAVAKGKHKYDKREDEKKKAIEKSIRQYSKERY